MDVLKIKKDLNSGVYPSEIILKYVKRFCTKIYTRALARRENLKDGRIFFSSMRMETLW